MNNYFECKVRYDRTNTDGVNKSVTESYLVDAVSHAEAEERIIREITPYASGELSVLGVKRVKIAEIFGLETEKGDRWYRAKVNFISLDEEKGVEKRTAVTMYARADGFENALEAFVDRRSRMMADWEIAAIVETPIIDVYPYADAPQEKAFYDEDENE